MDDKGPGCQADRQTVLRHPPNAFITAQGKQTSEFQSHTRVLKHSQFRHGSSIPYAPNVSEINKKSPLKNCLCTSGIECLCQWHNPARNKPNLRKCLFLLVLNVILE